MFLGLDAGGTKTHAVLTTREGNPVAEAISGRFAGVNVQGGEVYIRGINSINGPNAALYVVDGIPTDYIANIDPCQVKNISIIKDGSSAIYGSRGANGVVLITLKGGGD